MDIDHSFNGLQSYLPGIDNKGRPSMMPYKMAGALVCFLLEQDFQTVYSLLNYQILSDICLVTIITAYFD